MSVLAVDPRREVATVNDQREHLLGAFEGRHDGPTLIVIGSLHGNEPAGATALSSMLRQMDSVEKHLNGRVYFVAGNLRALAAGKRYVDTDLNRSWPGSSNRPRISGFEHTSEFIEQDELDRLIDSILITAMDEVFVLDLHSTSSEGQPFATIGDTLRNRKFAQKFPVSILLGIEEQLDGTMLEYLNNAGAVTLGFEGGQHLSESTIDNHRAMVWLAMVNSGILPAPKVPGFSGHVERLTSSGKGMRIFEVRYRHRISDTDAFEMLPGFNNFDRVEEGQVLAHDRYSEVRAPEAGLILMPLYQSLGQDGFFLGREISPFWLWLSGVLRRLGVQKMVHVLPGVSRDPGDPATLIVDTHIARIFPLQVFHLLGYRRRRWAAKKLVVSRRKHDATGPFRWKAERM